MPMGEAFVHNGDAFQCSLTPRTSFPKEKNAPSGIDSVCHCVFPMRARLKMGRRLAARGPRSESQSRSEPQPTTSKFQSSQTRSSSRQAMRSSSTRASTTRRPTVRSHRQRQQRLLVGPQQSPRCQGSQGWQGWQGWHGQGQGQASQVIFGTQPTTACALAHARREHKHVLFASALVMKCF